MFRFKSLGFRVLGSKVSGSRVSVSGFWVQVLGFRVGLNNSDRVLGVYMLCHCYKYDLYGNVLGKYCSCAVYCHRLLTDTTRETTQTGPTLISRG